MIEKFFKQKNNALILAMVALVVIIIALPTLKLGFFSDDFHMLTVARDHRVGLNYFLTNIEGTRGGSSYGPVLNIVFGLQYALFGSNAFGYHVMNILLHVGVTILVFLIGFKITKNKLVCTGAALWFAVMQNHVSSVAWVAVQPHLIATFLYLLGIYFYINFVENQKTKWYLLSLVSITLALFTKEITITALVVLPIIDWFTNNNESKTKTVRRIVKRIIPLVIITVIFFALRNYATGYIAGSYTGAIGIDVKAMFAMFIEMTANLFVSGDLRAQIGELALRYTYIVGGVVILMLFALYKVIPKKDLKVTVLLLSIYTFLAVPFVTLAFNPMTNEGERYTYLTSTFGALLFIWILYRLFSNTKTQKQWFMVGLVLLVLSSIVVFSNKLVHWKLADQIVQKSLSSLESIEEDGYHLFIGMPDNIAGAQIFRNAIQEALFIKTGKQLVGERLPIYVQLYENMVNQEYILKKVDNTLSLEAPEAQKKAFTGFPVVDHELITVIMQDFSKKGHLGYSVTGEWTQGGYQEIIPIKVVYYSNHAFKVVEIAE